MSKLLNYKHGGLLSIHGHSFQKDHQSGSHHLTNQYSRTASLCALGTVLSGLLAFPSTNIGLQHVSTLTACGNNDSHDPNQPSTSGMSSSWPAKRAKRISSTSSSDLDDSRSETLFGTSTESSLSNRNSSSLGDTGSDTLSTASVTEPPSPRRLSTIDDNRNVPVSRTSSPNLDDHGRAILSRTTSEHDNTCPVAGSVMRHTDPKQMASELSETVLQLQRALKLIRTVKPSDSASPLRANNSKTSISIAQDMVKTLGISLRTAEYVISASVPNAPHRRCLISRLKHLHGPNHLLPSLYSEMKAKKREFYCAAIATAVPVLIREVKQALKEHWGWEPDQASKQAAMHILYSRNWTTRPLQTIEMKSLISELVDDRDISLEETRIYGMSVYRNIMQELIKRLKARDPDPLSFVHAENLRTLLLAWNNHLRLGMYIPGLAHSLLNQIPPPKNMRVKPTKGSPLLLQDKFRWCAGRGSN